MACVYISGMRLRSIGHVPLTGNKMRSMKKDSCSGVNDSGPQRRHWIDEKKESECAQQYKCDWLSERTSVTLLQAHRAANPLSHQ